MPQSKLAFFRYLLIDQLISSKFKPYPSKDELLEACKEKFGVVSVSTIEKDLNAMRIEFDAPISFHRIKKGYYYSEPDFQLFNINLSEDQRLALSFVSSYLEGFKQLPFFAEFEGAINKILDGIELSNMQWDVHQPLHQILQVEHSPYLKESDQLQELVRHTASKKVLKLAYKKFESTEVKEYVIHPYLLKEYKDFWYLTGYIPAYQSFRTFAVDRILDYQIEETVHFISPETVGFQGEEYFKQCIGVSLLSPNPEKIRLRFSSKLGNYIKTHPLHPSQQLISDTSAGTEITLHLIDNFELRSLILSYGAEIEVLSPASLREAISKELKKSMKFYQD